MEGHVLSRRLRSHCSGEVDVVEAAESGLGLLDFLEGLPRDRLGPWVCSGWESVIKDADASQRFDRMLQAWGRDGSAILKAAAQGVLRTRQGSR